MAKLSWRIWVLIIALALFTNIFTRAEYGVISLIYIVIGFFTVLYLVFYFAGHGWYLGAERAKQKAHKEFMDRALEGFNDN